MNWVADECIDAAVVRLLRADGHQVVYIAEAAQGITDDEVLAIARESQSLLITADKDFGELVFRRRQTSPGVLLLRLPGVVSERRAGLVLEAVRLYGTEFLGAFTVITETSVRVRPGPT